LSGNIASCGWNLFSGMLYYLHSFKDKYQIISYTLLQILLSSEFSQKQKQKTSKNTSNLLKFLLPLKKKKKLTNNVYQTHKQKSIKNPKFYAYNSTVIIFQNIGAKIFKV